MSFRFAIHMAWREWRSSRKKLGLYMGSITLGVAALVAINSFGRDVSSSIRSESRALLGADLELRSRRPFPDSVQRVIDSLAADGVRISYVTSFGSMALVKRNGRTRLVEIRAVSGEFPYYGEITTLPTGLWHRFRDSRQALVDPALLIQLDAVAGDALAVGETQFVIAGIVSTAPGDVAIRAALGPRVYIPAAYLDETGLLQFGSRARYRAYLQIEDNTELQRFLNRYNELFRRHRVGYDTVQEREEDLTAALTNLSKFLGLVGLAALLLGGIGVASAVHVFVKEKIPTVAVLRCLGTTQPTVFSVYLLQAGVLGFLGAAAGTLLGVLVQANLPTVLSDFLPLDVTVSLQWPAILAGLGIGTWVALIFALLPLLQIRDVTPLRALRSDFGPKAPSRKVYRDFWRVLAYAALGLSVLLLSAWQAPIASVGFGFAGAMAATAALLWCTAWVLTKVTRKFFPSRARYVVRQGIANLFRPHNQTTEVILALGLGVFLMATIYVVQRSLLDQFALNASPDRPNLVVFDIQQDQRDGVLDQLRSRSLPLVDLTPIVSARIAGINGESSDELLAAESGPRRSRWALRREYHNTYRAHKTESERIIAGEWWSEKREGPARISVEADLAGELAIGVGDRLTWDVQGVQVETVVASLRSVNWARFETNFFVVFEPGVIDNVPHSYVVLTRVVDPTTRAELQRDLVQLYPNIAALDLTLVQETLDAILSRASLAVRFMALFCLASGVIVLIGATATSRFQRLRESVLLKTIGAQSRQIFQILFTEYLALGSLAGLAGILLATAAGWALMKFLFELKFALPLAPLVNIWIGVAVLTIGVGLLNSRKVVKQKPLAVLRELGQ